MLKENHHSNTKGIENGVMLNAYPDSIGQDLGDLIKLLKMPELKEVFSLFYVLPTFFNSDLDRGFSIIDYDLNNELVSVKDLAAFDQLKIQLKLDIVLNHLSVASPQFKDLLKHGEESMFKDFFINWNSFWEGHGEMQEDGVILPNAAYLEKLFMRKPGLPILKVSFPDGSEKPYWNTFYQQVHYEKLTIDDLKDLEGITSNDALGICQKVNESIANNNDLESLTFKEFDHLKDDILRMVNRKRRYLGQMDVNASSELVWDFYDQTLKKLSGYGCKMLRLDAFAYLHKEIGQSNFFNKPGTWEHLERIKGIAQKYDLLLLPEIHAEYGLHLHDQVADKGYYIYDFFLPGLIIHTIEKRNSEAILKWAHEIIDKGYKTVNMLGCHDGIPVLDLKGKEVNGVYNEGLLSDREIDDMINIILDRGGRVKNLYGPSGKKISYYQVNATFFSALGEDEKKLLLARAIQLFMPGIPQIWYLDLFAGKNDYKAADKGGNAGHKEINRTSLSQTKVHQSLKTTIVRHQIELMRIRNTSKAFSGTLQINKTSSSEFEMTWSYQTETAQLKVDLNTYDFIVSHSKNGILKTDFFKL